MPAIERTSDEPTTTLRLVRAASDASPQVDEGKGSATDSSLPAGTVTFLLTDIVGSTQLWERAPEQMAVALRRHEALIADAVAANGGARPLEQGEGDSVVAAFTRASEAVSAALAAQAALESEPWPEGIELRVRMALHTGEAHLQEGRSYAGPDLNRCARLRGLAHGGQVLLSRITHGLVADRPPQAVNFRDLGTYRLRGAEVPEQVHQLCHPSLRDDFAPLASSDVQPTNLPNPPSSLIGRVREMTEVRSLLADARVVTLTGSGGCGKSRLALELARTSRADHPDGVWWIDLAPLADPALVPVALADVLGGRTDPGGDPIVAVANELGNQDALIVLDNAEHLLEVSAAVTEHLVTACPRLRVMVTSREPLGIDGEWTWRVPSLPLADRGETSEAAIGESEAVQLFVTRAAQVRPGFELTADNAVAIAQVCHRLDGIPLAVELAAARVRVLSPARIASGLDDRFRLLTGGSRRAMPRQQTLESSVAWSYELLDDHERMAFRRLAPFAGGFTLAAAEHVVADDTIDEHAVLDLLTRLVDKSLVAVDTNRDEARYSMLETLRQFATKQMNEAGDTEAARDRHLAYFEALATDAEPNLTAGDQQLWLDLIEDDLDNLRAAWDWATARDDGDSLWCFAGDLAAFFVLHSHFADARMVVDRASELVPEPSGASLEGLWGDAYASVYGNDFERGMRSASRAIERARAAGDQRVLARALVSRGTLESYLDATTARETIGEAIPLARAVGDDWCLGDGLQMYAYTYLLCGDFEHGLEELAEGRAVAHRLQNPQLIAWDHIANSQKALRLGPLHDARREADAAMRAAELTGDPSTYGLGLVGVSLVELMHGRGVQMVPALEEGLERMEANGAGVTVPALAGALASAFVAADRLDDAREILDHHVDGFRGSLLLEVLNDTVAVPVAVRTGDLAAAESAARRMLAHAEQLRSGWAIGDAHHFLGHIALLRGAAGEAEDHAHEGLAAARKGPFLAQIADSLHLLASIAAELESDVEAVRLISAARTTLDTFGADITISGALLGVPSAAPLRQALGDATFEATWQEARALTTDEAVAYATRARGERKRPSAGWESLTPTESDVVSHLADGLTNREIAERMFIGAGTVKTHVAHIFAKLNMSRRSEVAAEFARRESAGS